MPGAASILGAIRQGTLDHELAGLLWVLLDGGIPLVVAGPGAAPSDVHRRRTILDVLLDLAPADRVRRTLSASEEFPWLAEVESLGWRRALPVVTDSGTDSGAEAVVLAEPVALAEPDRSLLLVGELGAAPPADTVGDRARLVVRALGLGFSLGATAQGARLEDVLETFRAQPIGLTDDELSRLGVVLILAPGDDSMPSKVAAAHYLRPLARDAHGHPQRLPPAVLATWNPGQGRFEHFAWGVAAELADRVGLRTGDFELERSRRAEALAGLAALDLADRTAERVALQQFRHDDAMVTGPGRPA